MEIVLTLVKYLTTAFSPQDFLLLSGGIFGVIGVLIFIAIKHKQTLLSFFGKGGEDKSILGIKIALDNLMTRAEINNSLLNLTMVIKHEISLSNRSTTDLRDKFVEISSLRQDIADREFLNVVSEIDELRKNMSSYNDTSIASLALIIASTNRTHETNARVLSQIEKIDQFVQAIAPEFRGYHRDLSNEVRTLSRDLALIERSIGLSINTSNTIKLR